MKKILKPGVKEEYELICDVTGKPALARLFWSGSRRDLEILDVHLSDEIAGDIVKLLQSQVSAVSGPGNGAWASLSVLRAAVGSVPQRKSARGEIVSKL
jgi:hypothetical protein